MDLTLDPRALAGPLTAIAAAGAGITILTEAAKQYVNTDRFPPPLIAGFIAALFTAALQLAQPEHPTARDAFPILMTWVGLFQTSIGVYHGAKLAVASRAGAEAVDKTAALHSFYQKLLDMKDRQIAEERDTVRVVPLTVPVPVVIGSPPPPPPETDPNRDVRLA